MSVSKLSFSSVACEALLVEAADNYWIEGEAVIVNATDVEATVNGVVITPWRSCVFANIAISGGRFIILKSSKKLDSLKNHSKREEIEEEWEHAFDIFEVEGLRNTELWRSAKDTSIPNVELNLWFASSGTECGIHNEHDFLEVHTQVSGLGIMQKFSSQSPSSLYSEVYMAPGYTHEPFCADDLSYPWHQYTAVSDCIWLAIEFYKG